MLSFTLINMTGCSRYFFYKNSELDKLSISTSMILAYCRYKKNFRRLGCKIVRVDMWRLYLKLTNVQQSSRFCINAGLWNNSSHDKRTSESTQVTTNIWEALLIWSKWHSFRLCLTNYIHDFKTGS